MTYLTAHKAKAALLIGALGLSACANVETATRNAPFETEPPAVAASDSVSRASMAPVPAARAQAPAEAGRLRIASYSVVVPRELRATDANVYYPMGDIVWHGDPKGDRHQQVAALFENSLTRSAEMITSGRPARVEIEVLRFHSVTDKTRYTVGGTHSIKFQLSAFDAETGAPLIEPRIVKADLNAYGGRKAIEAEAKGHTQKYRVTNHLVATLYRELTGETPQAITAEAVKVDTKPAKAEGRIALN